MHGARISVCVCVRACVCVCGDQATSGTVLLVWDLPYLDSLLSDSVTLGPSTTQTPDQHADRDSAPTSPAAESEVGQGVLALHRELVAARGGTLPSAEGAAEGYTGTSPGAGGVGTGAAGRGGQARRSSGDAEKSWAGSWTQSPVEPAPQVLCVQVEMEV